MTEPLPKDNRCGRCGEWFHNAHVCASSVKLRPTVGPWKCGDEFLPFHPSASHVNPDYRDGWNACFAAGLAAREAGT